MKNKESLRIVPISAVAGIVVAALVVCEVLVICGALEVRASAIAKIAPWAYEPFLRLVGEHPDSPAFRQNPQTVDPKDPVAGNMLPGYVPAPMEQGLKTNEAPPVLTLPDSSGAFPDEAPTSTPQRAVPVG